MIIMIITNHRKTKLILDNLIYLLYNYYLLLCKIWNYLLLKTFILITYEYLQNYMATNSINQINHQIHLYYIQIINGID